MGFPDRAAPWQFPYISFTASVQLRGDVMLGSGIIDVAIGLAFVFGVTAALSSVFTELIARFLGLRGAYLLAGLRELLDGTGGETALNDAVANYDEMKGLVKPSAPADGARKPTKSATGVLLGSPILRSQGMVGDISSRKLTVQPGKSGRPLQMTSAAGRWFQWRDCRSLPAYISAQSIGEAIIDLLVPNSAGATTMAKIQGGVKALPDWMPTLKTSLQALANNAGQDVKLFRTSVENWYDDHMSRVSGWYKRRVAKITIVIGAILILLLNINTLTIGRTLYSNSVVRTAVSSVAANSTSCPAGQKQQECLASLQSQLSAAAQAGLPIGWGTVTGCAAPTASCNWLERRGIYSPGGSPWQILLVLGGFLITIIALTPGARFWFDLLSRLGSLRSTGPKPASPAT
jgi:hypothetical protein